MKYLAYVHTASKWQSWDLNPHNAHFPSLSCCSPAFSHSVLVKGWKEVRLFRVLRALGHVKGATSCLLGLAGNKHTFPTEKRKNSVGTLYKDLGVGTLWVLSSKYTSKIFTVRQGFEQVRSMFTPRGLKREQG